MKFLSGLGKSAFFAVCPLSVNKKAVPLEAKLLAPLHKSPAPYLQILLLSSLRIFQNARVFYQQVSRGRTAILFRPSLPPASNLLRDKTSARQTKISNNSNENRKQLQLDICAYGHAGKEVDFSVQIENLLFGHCGNKIHTKLQLNKCTNLNWSNFAAKPST
jgi:hypothetical protein